VHCFDDVDEEAKAGQYIPSIDKAFYELRRCYKKLKDLQKHCDQFSRAVSPSPTLFTQLPSSANENQ
jgi:tetrahydromethanopterin S-methyltransferase subunit B